MKKTLYFAFFALMLFVTLGFATTNSVVFADLPSEVTASSIDIALYDSMGNSSPLPNENNVYSIDFHDFDENSAINATSNNPYGTFYIGITVNTQPLYEALTPDEKLQIFRDVRNGIFINGSSVSFGNSEITNAGNYIVYSPELSEFYEGARIFIRITPIKSAITSISCEVYNLSAQLTLNCEYATPNILTIDPPVSNQLYETFQPVTFTVTPNYQDWLDQDNPLTYEWTLNSQLQTGNTNTFTITNDMIAVGDYTIAVTIPGTTLQASAVLHIGTEQSYTVTVTHNGELEFVYGEYLESVGLITFNASIPVQEEYSVDWFLKSPDSSIYDFQLTAPAYDLFVNKNNLEEYSAGQYKVFAIVRYNSENYYSEIFTITINPAQVEESHTFTINMEQYENDYTGLTGYEFSIDAEDYFLSDQIVWFVRDDSGSRRSQTGFTFDFQPTEIKNYVITVYSQIGSDLTPLNSPGESITPRRIGQVVDIWVYVVIAAAVIVILGVVSIIISNKAREKIW